MIHRMIKAVVVAVVLMLVAVACGDDEVATTQAPTTQAPGNHCGKHAW